MIKKVTQVDSKQAWIFLQDRPWNNQNSLYHYTAIEGYLQGLGPTVSDWPAVRSELTKLSPKKNLSDHTVDRLVAQQWANSDLHAALDWYFQKHIDGKVSAISDIIDSSFRSRDHVISDLVDLLSGYDPTTAQKWAETIHDEDVRERILEQLIIQ